MICLPIALALITDRTKINCRQYLTTKTHCLHFPVHYWYELVTFFKCYRWWSVLRRKTCCLQMNVLTENEADCWPVLQSHSQTLALCSVKVWQVTGNRTLCLHGFNPASWLWCVPVVCFNISWMDDRIHNDTVMKTHNSWSSREWQTCQNRKLDIDL